MTTAKRWFSLAIAFTTVLVLGVGISIGLADDDTGAATRLAVLEQPPTLSAPVPAEIGGVPFTLIHDRTDLSARRLARSAAGFSYFVAPGVRPGEVCLLALAGSGAASSTCNPPSVLDSFGAIPLLSFRPDGGISVAAVVPDGAAEVRADDGSVGTVAGNVLLIDVGPSANAVEFTAPGGPVTLGPRSMEGGSPLGSTSPGARPRSASRATPSGAAAAGRRPAAHRKADGGPGHLPA